MFLSRKFCLQFGLFLSTKFLDIIMNSWYILAYCFLNPLHIWRWWSQPRSFFQDEHPQILQQPFAWLYPQCCHCSCLFPLKFKHKVLSWHPKLLKSCPYFSLLLISCCISPHFPATFSSIQSLLPIYTCSFIWPFICLLFSFCTECLC